MKKIIITALIFLSASSFAQKAKFDGLTMDFSKRGELRLYFQTREKVEYRIYEGGKEISYVSCLSCPDFSESWSKKKSKYTIVYIKGNKKEKKEIKL
jgi:hypothetical protein